MSNQRPYDRNDNDTYIEIHSMDPASDVEAHMFFNPQGRSIGPGRVWGDFTTETRIKAANCVLQFPSAKAAGLINLGKHLKLATPMPMSLVKRYKKKPEKLTYAQQVPVFFDAKEERFVVLLDQRFLRDIRPEELRLSEKQYRGKVKIYKAIKGKEEPLATHYLGLLYDSIEAVRNDHPDSALSLVGAAYRLYNLRIEDGEKVILLKVAKDKDTMSMLVKDRLSGNNFTQLIRHQFKFEFAVAYRFADVCYLESPEGGIDQATSFHLDKKAHQEGVITHIGKIRVDEHSPLLVIPYSDEQFELISKIHSRMSELASDIMALVEMHQSFGDAVDKPIDPSAGALPWIAPLLLERD